MALNQRNSNFKRGNQLLLCVKDTANRNTVQKTFKIWRMIRQADDNAEGLGGRSSCSN